jgi:hypothetical protein
MAGSPLKRFRKKRNGRRRWLYKVFCPHIQETLFCTWSPGVPTIAVLTDADGWRPADFLEHMLIGAEMARDTPYARFYGPEARSRSSPVRNEEGRSLDDDRPLV